MKSKVVDAVPKISLGSESNPIFDLDEDNLPPEYTPRVLLDDDFDQYVETSDSPARVATETDGTNAKQSVNTTIFPLIMILLKDCCLVHHRPSYLTKLSL